MSTFLLVFSHGLLLKKPLWPLFMDGAQLLQDYRATAGGQFTFYHYPASYSLFFNSFFIISKILRLSFFIF